MRPEQQKGAAPGLPPAEAPARPEAPLPRLWKLPGYGKLRATGRPPRSFPHPLEIPARTLPPIRDSHSSHSRGDEEERQGRCP